MKLNKSNIYDYIKGNELNCINRDITSIEDIPDHITRLYCWSNKLTSLPKLPIGLIRLDCRYNRLTILPMLPDSLISLYCSGNKLTRYTVGDPHSGYPKHSLYKQWMINHNNHLKLLNRLTIINKIYETK